MCNCENMYCFMRFLRLFIFDILAYIICNIKPITIAIIQYIDFFKRCHQ